jgi:hypothetical protein
VFWDQVLAAGQATVGAVSENCPSSKSLTSPDKLCTCDVVTDVAISEICK